MEYPCIYLVERGSSRKIGLSKVPHKRIDTDYRQLMPIQDRRAYIFPVKDRYHSEKVLKEWLLACGYRNKYTESLREDITQEDVDDILAYMAYLMKKDDSKAKMLKFGPGENVVIPRRLMKKKVPDAIDEDYCPAPVYRPDPISQYPTDQMEVTEIGEDDRLPLVEEAFNQLDKIWGTGLSMTNRGRQDFQGCLYIHLQRVKSGQCPFSSIVHESGNAYILVTPDESVMFGCHHGCKLKHGKKLININTHNDGVDHVILAKIMAELKRM